MLRKMKYNPCAVLCLVMLPLLTFTTLFCIPVEYVSQIANQFDRLAGEPPLLHPFSYSSSWESVSIPGFKFNFNLTSNSSLLMTNRTYDSAWYLNKSLAFPPYPCIVARATDIFLNASATGCRAWCRRELGPSSGLLHALSPLHWLLVQRSWDFVFSLDYGMCFKAETSAWALTWFPSQFLSWLVASTYGSIAIITFFCKLVACPREFVASGPSPNEMRPNDQAVKPWHEPPFTNDRARSQFQLSRSAIFLLMETAQDLLSIIMFLRFGQPVYAMGMCFFVLCSRLHAGDVFQVGGAGALARSLARGFATKEMYQHFASEVIEGMGGTLIQLYALFVGRYENDAFAILCINVYTSLMVTVPNGFEAWSLLHRDVQEFFDDYYAVQKLRSQTSWLWKFLPSLLAVLIAAVASANAPSEGSRFLNETFVRREVLKAYRIPSTDKERFGWVILWLMLLYLYLDLLSLYCTELFLHMQVPQPWADYLGVALTGVVVLLAVYLAWLCLRRLVACVRACVQQLLAACMRTVQDVATIEEESLLCCVDQNHCEVRNSGSRISGHSLEP